jgi:hypothetical protein
MKSEDNGRCSNRDGQLDGVCAWTNIQHISRRDDAFGEASSWCDEYTQLEQHKEDIVGLCDEVDAKVRAWQNDDVMSVSAKRAGRIA